jgi:hypothetical protein
MTTPDRDATRARDERRFLLGLAVVVACSWGRWLATGSLKVDENYPSGTSGTLLFVTLAGGFALLVLGWTGFLRRPPSNPRKLAFGGLLVSALMLPMLSNDVFSVLTYGSTAARGHDVYTTAAFIPESTWYSWVGQRWSTKVCVYGPADLLFMLPAGFAGNSPWIALGVLRLTFFVPLVVAMETSFRLLGDRPFFHAMVWLNPLWILEGPGQLHADLLGLAAIAFGVAVQRRGRTKTAWVSYAFAVVGKYSFAFTGLWFWLFGTRRLGERLTRAAAMAGILAGVGVVLFAPFWHGPATLFEPIRALSATNPGGSITEVVGTIVHVVRGGALPSPNVPVREAMELDRAANAATWFVVSMLMKLVALGVTVRVLRAALRKPVDDDAIAYATGVIVVAAFTLASHRFQCWYLVAALPFFGLRCPDVWRRWWIAAVCVSVSMDFANVLPRTAVLFSAWVGLSTAALMVVFLMSFRARYWRLSGLAEPEAGLTAPDWLAAR